MPISGGKYVAPTWVDNSPPAIDADELQAMSNSIVNNQTAIDAKPDTGDIPSAYTSSPAMDGVASAGSSTNWSRGDHVHPTDTTRAPTSHASSATTYGAATSTNYGHVKLSDSTTSTSGASSGVAATPAAVKSAINALEAQISSPYNFKGSVATVGDLPASGNTVNDTYYVTGAKCRYTWTGSAWAQSSMDEADYEDELGDLKNALIKFNSYDLLRPAATYSDKTSSGVIYTWDAAHNACTVDGTATGASINNMYAGAGLLPGMVAGNTYLVKVKSTNSALGLQFLQYDSNNTQLSSNKFTVDGLLTIHQDAVRIVVRLAVPTGTVLDNDSISDLAVLTELSNKELAESIESIYADYTDELGDLKNALTDFNSTNLFYKRESKSSFGITFAWNGDECTISGTSTSSSVVLDFLIGASNQPEMPRGIEPGKSYQVRVQDLSNGLCLRITSYNGSTSLGNSDFFGNGEYVCPENTTAITAFLRVSAGATVQQTVKPIMLSAATNAELEKSTLKVTAPTNVVAENDDFDDYLTPGQWRIPTTHIANSLKHKPVGLDTTGTVVIMNTHNTNHVYQIIFTNGTTNIWARHIMIDVGRFDDWKSLTTAENNGFLWQSPGFVLHSPQEETIDMQTVFEEYLEKTITSTHYWATRTDNFRNVPASDIYALWDALQSEYPDYIDEGETIGYSLDTDGTNYAPVKAYYIHPRMTDGANHAIPYNDMPTVYITAGTHGVEASPTWNLFAIFRRAFLTGTIYSAFLSGIKFRVVPCLSIWSYDHYKRYLAAAYNADGTQKVPDEDLPLYDANRMCICTDDTHPSYATLDIPTYAGEAKALTDYMQLHGFGDVDSKDIYLDLHNCSYSLGYLTSDDLNIRYTFNRVMDDLAKDWLARATYSNGDAVDYYNTSTDDHFALHGKILGNESIVNSFAWFFENAYAPFSSNILEVQAYDSSDAASSCNAFALAKGLDITYRWVKWLTGIIQAE